MRTPLDFVADPAVHSEAKRVYGEHPEEQDISKLQGFIDGFKGKRRVYSRLVEFFLRSDFRIDYSEGYREGKQARKKHRELVALGC